MDMRTGFTLVMFSSEVDCNRIFEGQHWFVGGQVFNLQHWKKNFDLVREHVISALLWVRISRPPLEVWKETTLSNLVKPVRKIFKLIFVLRLLRKDYLPRFVLLLIFLSHLKWILNIVGMERTCLLD